MSLVEQGYRHRRCGERAEALACFEQVLAIDPSDAGARLEAGHELRALRRLDAAEAHYNAVLAALPGHVEALFALAACARAREDRGAALAYFERILAFEPANPAARLAAGDELRTLRRPAEAEGHYLSLIEEQPDRADALLAMAECRHAQGDRATAIAWLQRALRADPSNDAARFRAAEELCTLGRFDEAEAMLDVLVARQTDNPHAWSALGRARRSAGRHEAALAAFGRASAADPARPQPMLDMAVQHRFLGRPREAGELLSRVLELDGDNAWAHMHLGEHARMADDFPAALRHFGRAHALLPSDRFAVAGFARALAETGRLEDALSVLDGAEGGPQADLAAMRVQLLREAGEWPLAREVARAAAEATPRHFGVWMERFKVERMADDREAVEACLARAPAVTPAELGRVHHFRGQHAEDGWLIAEAARHYEDAAALLPDDGGLHQDLARVRMLLGDPDGAIEHLRASSRAEVSKLLLQGRATNASQSQLGQIVDEFRCDPEALAALKAAQRLSPAERIAPLLSLTRRCPDYTPAAMLLMVASRQAGCAHRAGAAAPVPVIPRKLVQYWHEAEPPADVRALTNSWRTKHPEFAWRLFHDAEAREFIAEKHSRKVLEAYCRAREPAHRADLFRLAYLAVEGGFYVDADDRCLGHLSGIVSDGARFFGYLEEYGALGNDIIGAVPSEPVIVKALDLAVEATNRGDRDILWLSTGPGLLTHAYVAVINAEQDEAGIRSAARQILDRRQLFAAVAIHCFLAYKKSNRHWLQAAFGGAKERRTTGSAL